jgi:hypothetical protein
MTYRQLSPAERYMLAALRRQGLNRPKPSSVTSAYGSGLRVEHEDFELNKFQRIEEAIP